jgi:hypothetical protein
MLPSAFTESALAHNVVLTQLDTPMKKEVKSDPSPFSKENDELAEV